MTETSNSVATIVTEQAKEKCTECGAMVAADVAHCPECKHYMWGNIDDQDGCSDD